MRLLPSLALLALFAQPVLADSSAIKDEAGFFKPETIKQADKLINKIRERHGVRVVVETVAEIPGLEDPKQKEKLTTLEKEAQMRADARTAAIKAETKKGGKDAKQSRLLYILITRKPEDVAVVSSPRSEAKKSEPGWASIANGLAKDLRKDLPKEPDKVLLATLERQARWLRTLSAIKDSAGFFKVDTIEEAGKPIDQIYDRFGFHIIIETVEEVSEVAGLKKKQRAAAIKKEARNRADAQYSELKAEAKKRGEDTEHSRLLYVLITRKPDNYVEVVGWPSDFEAEMYGPAWWSTRDVLADELRRGLLKDPDRALLAALGRYRTWIVTRQRPSSPLNTVTALLLVAGLVGAWVVLALLRRRLTASGRLLPTYQPAMLGSLFGVPAGYWVNDRLFQAERPAVLTLPVEPPPRPPSDAVIDMAGEPDSHLLGSEPERGPTEGDRL